METNRDKLRAFVFAIGLHALVVGFLFVSLLRQPLPVAIVKGSVIEATLVSSLQPSAAINAIEQETAQATTTPLALETEPKPHDTPQPRQLSPQVPLPRPDARNEEDALHSDKQVVQKELQDQRVQLAQNNPPAPIGAVHSPIGNNRDDMAGLLERYRAALHTTAIANWDPVGVPSGVHCMVRFVQIPGGEVISVNYEDCPLDALARESIERAMHKDSMPYAGFETVFSRQATIDFCYPEEACLK